MSENNDAGGRGSGRGGGSGVTVVTSMFLISISLVLMADGLRLVPGDDLAFRFGMCVVLFWLIFSGLVLAYICYKFVEAVEE